MQPLLVLAIFLIVSFAVSSYILTLQKSKTDESVDEIFNAEDQKLRKTLPMIMGTTAHLLVDLVCGDLIAGNDQSEKFANEIGSQDLSAKNGDNLFFWLKICYLFFPISYLVGLTHLLLAERRGNQNLAKLSTPQPRG